MGGGGGALGEQPAGSTSYTGRRPAHGHRLTVLESPGECAADEGSRSGSLSVELAVVRLTAAGPGELADAFCLH